MPRILITGGSGRLGSAIRHAVESDLFAPPSRELNVLDWRSCRRVVDLIAPDVVIHCAAFANAVKAETEREACWDLNFEGARNMARASEGRRFVHVSTDYVFDGQKGCYSEDDPPNPINFYGVSKLAAEVAVLHMHGDALVVRAPFRADPPWRFAGAFVDQWTSCRFASEVAPDVVVAALSGARGVLHVGGPRRSIHELASMASPVSMMTRDEFKGLRIPRDTSLDSSKWHSLRRA